MEEVPYLNSPEFYSLCLYILGTVSLPIHLFGAYCILCQTPDTMKRVKWVMFNLHCWSCSLDILLGLLGQPFIVPPVFGGAPMGLLHLLNVDPGIMVYVMVTLILMVSISTGAIFENRFYLLFAEKTWWRYCRYPFYIINISLAFLYYVPTMIGIPDQKVARDWIFEKYPQVRRFDSPDHPIYVVAYDSVARDWIGIRMIVSTVIVGLENLTFIILLIWKMKHAVREMTMSEKTLTAQRSFLRAVYMQVAIPAGIIATPQILIIFIGYLDLNTPGMNSIAYMTMSIHGASATLIMLYCHTPYRVFCKALFCRKFRVFERFTPSVTVN
uniref:Serpentine Receptor, class H n=1 Tax=Caenorhabditis tropicalis TaxID=1561998 RepID=A0A1I7TUS8_9PELO